MDPSKQIDDALLSLAWSLWTELGVAGVERHHRDSAVDPEVLIAFTAGLADADPRLRDESLDCALELAPYLSMSRLKNVVHTFDEGTQKSFASYAATFNAASKSHVRFPPSDGARAWRFQRSGKSMASDFSLPSQLFLRLRAAFGVGARADVLTTVLALPDTGWLASDLSARLGIAKRVIANALDDLERAGVVRSAQVVNRLRYNIARRVDAEAFVGALPRRCPPWTVLLPWLLRVRSLARGAGARRDIAVLVDAQSLVEELLRRQGALGASSAMPVLDALPEAWRWLVKQVAGVADGTAAWLGGGESRKPGRTAKR